MNKEERIEQLNDKDNGGRMEKDIHYAVNVVVQTKNINKRKKPEDLVT